MNDQIKAKWWAALVVCLVATGCGDSGAGSATTDATGIGVTSEPTTTESTTTERAIEEAGPASSDCPSAGQDGSTATGSEADSLTWTQVDPPGGVETVFDVLHDGRLLAIAEEADTTGSTLYTSSDGQRWDPLTTLPLTVLGADIGPDVWVVVGGQAESAVQTMGASTVPLRFPRATELVAQVSADDGQSWSELPVPVELDDRPFVYSSVGVDGLAVDGDTMLVLARANARVDPAGAVIEAGLATATDTIIPLFDESGISAWVGTEAGGEVVSIELDELGIDTAEYDDLLGGEPNTSLLVSIGGADFSIAELPLSETAFPIDLAHTPSGFTVTTVDPGQDFAEASFFSADGRQWTESEDAEVSILDVEGAWTLGMTRGFPPQVVQSFDCAANWNPLPTPPGAAQPGDGPPTELRGRAVDGWRLPRLWGCLHPHRGWLDCHLAEPRAGRDHAARRIDTDARLLRAPSRRCDRRHLPDPLGRRP